MISVHRLEGFYFAAVTGGFARAARAFPYPITAQAVYQQVRKLELELGARLLQRVGKDQLALTSAGRALFSHCEPFFRELPLLERALRESTFGGVLRIEAAALELRHFLPPWLARLAQLRPDIAVQVDEVPFGDAQRLLRGEADLLVEHQPRLPAGVSAQTVGCYQAFLVARAGVLPQGSTRTTLARRLNALPFVGFPSRMPQYALQEDGLARLGLSGVARGPSASSTEALLAFARAGLGFTLIPWPDRLGPRDAELDVRALRGSGTSFPVVAAYRARPPDPLVRAALELA